MNNGIEQIKIDDNVFSLNSNEKFGNVYLLNDGYVFVLMYSSDYDKSFILDRSLNIVNNFKDYYDDNFIYNGIKYHDGYIDVYSTIGIHSSSVCYYSLNYNSSDIVKKMVSYKYIGNGTIGAPILIKEDSFADYLEEQTGYNNCNEFLKAHPIEE